MTLMVYLDGNRRLFDAGVNAIPGAALDAAGGDLSRLGRFRRHRHDDGRIHRAGGKGGADRHQPRRSFGAGGETFLRFNLGAPRAQIAEAVARLQRAFADLQ